MSDSKEYITAKDIASIATFAGAIAMGVIAISTTIVNVVSAYETYTEETKKDEGDSK